jgi:hypothetical protein
MEPENVAAMIKIMVRDLIVVARGHLILDRLPIIVFPTLSK